MSTHSLVVPKSTEFDWGFTGIAKNAHRLHKDLTKGDWGDALGASWDLTNDVAGALADPLLTAAKAGVSIILDYVHPISDWYNELVGDPKAISAASLTWDNIGQHLSSVGNNLSEKTAQTLDQMNSLTTSAAAKLIREASGSLGAISLLCTGMAYAVEEAGNLVKTVRNEIRDALAKLVKKYAVSLLVAAGTAGASLAPTLTLLAMEVALLAQQLSQRIIAVLKSFQRLQFLFNQVNALLESVRGLFDKLGGNPAGDLLKTHMKDKAKNPFAKLAEGADYNSWSDPTPKAKEGSEPTEPAKPSRPLRVDRRK